jgi:dienelactone hydrolase
MPTHPSWSIRTLLNPVVARLLIFGVNPFDLERVLRAIEETPLRNARQLEALWLERWEGLARGWEQRRQMGPSMSSRRTRLAMGLEASACRLAQFLINPGDLERRRAIYEQFVDTYRDAVKHFEPCVESLQIELDGDSKLAAVLHLPPGATPHPVVAVYAGLGSCKEEMNTLARLLVERGVAAIVPDMPGNGESLFVYGVSCGSKELTRAFAAVADFVEGEPRLDATRFGAVGLCMGGGYAYRACSEERRYRYCATLFPLFIDLVDATSTPAWMKSGPWYDLQSGNKDASTFLAEVGWRDEFAVDCPFFMAHSRHDNWMPLERAMALYEKAPPSTRELVLVEDEPVYAAGEAALHTMPVGEQLGWVGPVMADWIAVQAKAELRRGIS